MRPQAEVLAVGDELLRGEIVNGNAAWLGEQLAALGWPVTRSTVVGDDVVTIADVIGDALTRVPVVVISGGLGPTQDDLTREGIARAAGVGIARDADLEARLLARYASAGRTGRAVPTRNLKQADLPAGAHAFDNPVGSAPGIAMRIGAGLVLALPGVPAELQAMVRGAVPAELASLGIPAAVRVSVAVRTAGLWESEVAELISDVELRARAAGSPEVAFLASGGQTRVVLTAGSIDELAPWVAEVRSRLGGSVVEVGPPGVDPTALPRAVVAALMDRGQSVACAESLTAGLVTAALGDVPGVSAVLRGGVTAYSNDVKATVLGVAELEQHGPVSEHTARAMATGVRAVLGVDWGLATTGVAGPGPADGHESGTVFIAVSGPQETVSRRLQLPGGRSSVRSLSVVAVLDLLRRELNGPPGG